MGWGGFSDVHVSRSSVMAPSEIQFAAAVPRRNLEIHAFWFLTPYVQSLGRDSELGGSKVL